MTQLFDDLSAGGAMAIRALVGKSESLEVDFKQRGPGNKEDKRVLGKALSAFANSMGGTLVWGVDCRRDADGVDQVVGFVPIQGLARFASAMRDLVVDALMPRHEGIRVEALSEGNDTGFLIMDVPRSERRPHRSEFGEKYYYRRAGASSRPMEHFEIEDAFKWQTIPSLVVQSRVTASGSIRNGDGSGERGVCVQIMLMNDGSVSARQPYVTVAGPFNSIRPPNPQFIKSQNGASLITISDPVGAVHPGMLFQIALFDRTFRIGTRNGFACVSSAELPITLDVDYGCYDMRIRHTILRVISEDVLTAIDPRKELEVI